MSNSFFFSSVILIIFYHELLSNNTLQGGKVIMQMFWTYHIIKHWLCKLFSILWNIMVQFIESVK